jgi:hypothetical protein
MHPLFFAREERVGAMVGGLIIMIMAFCYAVALSEANISK